MSDKQPMQASGGGTQAGAGKETEGQLRSGGQSGGAAYPNDASSGTDVNQEQPSAEEGGFIGESGESGAADRADPAGDEVPAKDSAVRDRAG